MIKYCNTHRTIINKILWLLAILSVIYLSLDFNSSDNPFEYLMNYTGHGAMIAFVLTLSITPLRSWLSWFAKRMSYSYGKRLSDWNFLIYNRRMLGLICYYYACLHGFIYCYFELDFDWYELWFDAASRIHIA